MGGRKEGKGRSEICGLLAGMPRVSSWLSCFCSFVHKPFVRVANLGAIISKALLYATILNFPRHKVHYSGACLGSSYKEHFSLPEPQNPPLIVSELHKIRQLADFETLKL